MPGLIFIDTLAHEYYHYINHKEIVEEFCIDFNTDTDGHISLRLPENSTMKFFPEEIEKEEKIASLVGRSAAVLYLVNAILVLILLFHILTRIEKK